MDNNIVLIIEFLIVLFIIYSCFKRFFGSKKETLYLSEKYIGIDSPIAIHGYPDRVIKTKDGYLRVDDFKTRNQSRVYDSDIWQLSCYKYILRRTQKLPVMEESKVLVKSKGQVKEVVVRLKSDEEVEKLYNSYQEIVEGSRKATLCNNKKFCARCPYNQKQCFPNV